MSKSDFFVVKEIKGLQVSGKNLIVFTHHTERSPFYLRR